MRILLVHNRYQQPGGEDQVFAAERQLLRAHGHDVTCYTADNRDIGDSGRIAVAARTVWSRKAYRELRELIQERRPEVAHFHNTLPLVSPAGYYAARAEGVPVVQTLHNYRLICPGATLFRNGQVCERCLSSRAFVPALRHRCYRGSLAATGTVAAMVTVHRWLRTWDNIVDRYVALTHFAREKFVSSGIPASKITVKPNFVQPDPGLGEGKGGFAIFVGRLAPEKGIDTLLRAWEQVGPTLPLKVVGDGPLADRVLGRDRHHVEWLGRRGSAETRELIGQAAMLVFPSEWYETFGLVAVEAFACGTPVVASRLGAMAEIVDAGRTGELFAAGDAEDLAATVLRLAGDRSTLRAMRREARQEYEAKYTASANYSLILDIYRSLTSPDPASTPHTSVC